jgi:hypothetical protein
MLCGSKVNLRATEICNHQKQITTRWSKVNHATYQLHFIVWVTKQLLPYTIYLHGGNWIGLPGTDSENYGL